MRAVDLEVHGVKTLLLVIGIRHHRVLMAVEDGRVVELLEGVQENLPVAANVAAVVVALRQLFERVVDRGDHRAEEFGECLPRLLGEVHEDEPLPHLAVHRHEAVVGPVDPEELALLKDEGAPAVEIVLPAVVLAGELPAGSTDPSAGWSVHTSLLPRWRQTLWKARISSSKPRTTISEVLATASSLVKKLPFRRSCSTRPTFSQARLKMASRSSW